MSRRRALHLAVVLAGTTLLGVEQPVAAAEASPAAVMTAYLDGKPIPTSDVGLYFCDDFSYPVIQCSRTKLTTDLRATMAFLLGTDYATIYEYAQYSGVYMNISQDYGMLATIGWNDKISSFKGRNSETGRFWTDWFNSGSSWSFCCNSQVSSLGSYDNTFSSVQRT